MFLPTPYMMENSRSALQPPENREGPAHGDYLCVMEKPSLGTGYVAGTALCEAPNSLFFLQVRVHPSGRVPARPAGDTLFHCDDFCICELLAWWARLPLVLGSAQLAGSHCGERSPEACGDPVCPGQPGEQEPCSCGRGQVGQGARFGREGRHQIQRIMGPSC